MVEWSPDKDGTVPRYDATTAAYVDSPVPSTTVQAFADTDDGEAIIDCSNVAAATIVLTDDTMIELNNVPDDADVWSIDLIITQGAGPFSITWPVTNQWASGTAPTLSAGAGDVDIFRFTSYDGGTVWYGQTIGQAFAEPA